MSNIPTPGMDLPGVDNIQIFVPSAKRTNNTIVELYMIDRYWFFALQIFVCLYSIEAKCDDYISALEASKKNDFTNAFKLLKPLAEKGDVRAQGELGALYLFGRGTPRDIKLGVHWTTEAAKKGLASAQFNLGSMYMDGEVVTQNYHEAMKWLLSAAGQGVPPAQAGVAAMFYEGNGVPQDFREAFKWMKIAASNGDPEAQLNLGTMYAFGQGTNRDVLKGAMWTFIATDSPSYSPSEKSSLRELSFKTLNKEEFTKVNEMSKKCRESNLKDC